MSPGHPRASFGSLCKSLGSGYTHNSLCVTNIGGRTSMTWGSWSMTLPRHIRHANLLDITISATEERVPYSVSSHRRGLWSLSHLLWSSDTYPCATPRSTHRSIPLLVPCLRRAIASLCLLACASSSPLPAPVTSSEARHNLRRHRNVLLRDGMLRSELPALNLVIDKGLHRPCAS